jgi:hypothetical protein
MGNRELKFRVYNRKTSCFLTHGKDDLIAFSHLDWAKYYAGFGQYCANYSDYVFQEYTGLKDSLGREIYESDIISCDEYLGDSLKDGHHEKALVIFKDGAFWYSLDGGKNPHQLLMYGTNLKVIGNVFESPQREGDFPVLKAARAQIRELREHFEKQVSHKDKIQNLKDNFQKFGYIVPAGAQFFTFGESKKAYMKVGGYSHSCHVDSTDFHVLLGVSVDGKPELQSGHDFNCVEIAV